jgi:regulator of protease activity HflC (stomatin/prohibitin superfamily)
MLSTTTVYEQTPSSASSNTPKFLKLIERMEDLVISGVAVPFTPWTMVNADKLLPLVDRIRVVLPEEIKEATLFLEEQDRMLEQTRLQSIEMLQEAQEKSQYLLSESALMQAVQSEAERIRAQVVAEIETIQQETLAHCEQLKAQAEQEAASIQQAAQAYATDMLQGMEERLSELQDQVRYNQQHLNELRAAAISIRATQAARGAHAEVNTLNGRIPTAANLHQQQNQPMVSYASAPLVTTSPSPAQPEASVQAALSLLYGPAPSARSKRPATGSLKERKRALTNQEVQHQNQPSVELPY